MQRNRIFWHTYSIMRIFSACDHNYFKRISQSMFLGFVRAYSSNYHCRIEYTFCQNKITFQTRAERFVSIVFRFVCVFFRCCSRESVHET